MVWYKRLDKYVRWMWRYRTLHLWKTRQSGGVLNTEWIRTAPETWSSLLVTSALLDFLTKIREELIVTRVGGVNLKFFEIIWNLKFEDFIFAVYTIFCSISLLYISYAAWLVSFTKTHSACRQLCRGVTAIGFNRSAYQRVLMMHYLAWCRTLRRGS